MTNDESKIKAVVVPKELYYHEVAYVRALEGFADAAIALVSDMQQHEGAEGFSDSTRQLEAQYNELLAKLGRAS